MKLCRNKLCTTSNPRFHKASGNADGLCNVCTECKAVYRRNHYLRNKSKNNGQGRKYNRLRRGLTDEQFELLLQKQSGSCAICKSNTPGGSGDWHIDHDHKCCPANRSCGKCVRGLLCSKCNHALGLMRDDVDVLKNAIEYLKGSQCPIQSEM